MPTRFRRRDFLKSSGVAACGATVGAPALLASTGSLSSIGLAVVGLGARGKQLFEAALATPGVSVRAVSDLDSNNLAWARGQIPTPEFHASIEWEPVIHRRDVDAVVIATPDFWHAPMVLTAVHAKKHVWVEPHLCLNLEEASSIRSAVRESGIVFALGHQLRLDPAYLRARDLLRSGRLGLVRGVSIRAGRSRVWPEWRSFAGRRDFQEPRSVEWSRFHHKEGVQEFDRNRFDHWRCYWDYGLGIAGSLMSHQWDAMNMVLGLGIPPSVSTHVDLAFWRNGSEAPDSWRCVFSYPDRPLSIEFECEFRSGFTGESATIRTETGEHLISPAHSRYPKVIEEFVECLRGRCAPFCDIESAWEVAAAVDMSVESYRRGRPVRSTLI
jgi:predicted dehydrogenase